MRFKVYGDKEFTFNQHAEAAKLFYLAESRLWQIWGDYSRVLQAHAMDAMADGLRQLQMARVRLHEYFVDDEQHAERSPYRERDSIVGRHGSNYPKQFPLDHYRALVRELCELRNALVELSAQVNECYPSHFVAKPFVKCIPKVFDKPLARLNRLIEAGAAGSSDQRTRPQLEWLTEADRDRLLWLPRPTNSGETLPEEFRCVPRPGKWLKQAVAAAVKAGEIRCQWDRSDTIGCLLNSQFVGLLDHVVTTDGGTVLISEPYLRLTPDVAVEISELAGVLECDFYASEVAARWFPGATLRIEFFPYSEQRKTSNSQGKPQNWTGRTDRKVRTHGE